MPVGEEALKALKDLDEMAFIVPDADRPEDYPDGLPFAPGVPVRWQVLDGRVVAQWALEDRDPGAPGIFGPRGIGRLMGAMLGMDAPTAGEADRLAALLERLGQEATDLGWGTPESGEFPVFRAAKLKTFKDGARRLLLVTLPILGQCSVIGAAGAKPEHQ